MTGRLVNVPAGPAEGEAAGPASTPELNAYTSQQVITRAGITYRQLDYWARTGLATPSVQDAEGSGSQRLYSPADLWRVAIVKTLLDAGLSLAAVREILNEACEHENLVLSQHVRLHLRHEHLAARIHVEPPTALRLVAP